MTVWCYNCQKHVIANKIIQPNIDPKLETIEYSCTICNTVLQHRYREKEDLLAETDKM